jgi:hypothetical protein
VTKNDRRGPTDGGRGGGPSDGGRGGTRSGPPPTQETREYAQDEEPF